MRGVRKSEGGDCEILELWWPIGGRHCGSDGEKEVRTIEADTCRIERGCKNKKRHNIPEKISNSGTRNHVME